MSYSNSKFVNYTKISPNQSGTRNHKIDTVTIHCVVGQCSVEALGALFANPNKGASSNYGIGYDGKIGMYVEEKDRSWCTSSPENDNRAVTIEVASDITEPLAVTDAAYKSLIKLVADICKRNGIKKLVWSTNKSDRMNHRNGCNMTVHRDYANKSCPGTWLYNRHGQIAAEVNKILGAATPEPTPAITNVDTVYKVYAGGKWLPEVKNTDDYAGIENKPISGVYAKLSKGSIKYRVHTLWGKWLPWVKDYEDYAGIIGKPIDGIQMQLVGLSGYSVQYRVSTGKSTAYLPWVTNYNTSTSDGYAGIIGVTIDKLQIRIIKK